MSLFPRLTIVAALAAVVSVVPFPALSRSLPETLADPVALGDLSGESRVIDPAFPIDFVGVSWRTGETPFVRFRGEAGWTVWRPVHLDGLPRIEGRTFSALLAGADADAYRVRATAEGVRAIVINTTDGPRSLAWDQLDADATHLPQPAVISRPQWGADESLRSGTPSFYPTQKLIVHHTVTNNADPDPAATVRAIYYDHTQNRGFADIAYSFLIDAQGNIYKGRYSGKGGTAPDTLTGENANGKGVTGAHTGGYNSGTMGVAMLGTFTSVPPTPEARSALIDHLAWEADHHGLDPVATSTYVNPQSGDTKDAANISGHRDWGSTECPGGMLYADLPAIRQEAAARVGAVDSRPPRIKRVDEEKVGKRSAILVWETNEPADSQIRYRRSGTKWRELQRPRRSEDHRLRVARLKPDRRYSYRVGSADLNDNLAWSRRFTLETAA